MVFLGICLWLVFAVYRGYRKGLLVGVSGVLGLLLAYPVCFWGAEPLAGLFRNYLDMNWLTALILSVLGLYLGTALLVSGLVKVLCKRSAMTSSGSPFGAIFGFIWGVVSAAVFLWCLVLFKSALALDSPVSSLETRAVSIVGKAVNAGIELSGLDGMHAAGAQAMLRDPEEFVESFRALAKSEAFRHFLNDPLAAERMAESDLQGLLSTPSYKTLTNQPAFALLFDNMENAQEDVALRVMQGWQRMQVLKDDPEVGEILQDPEVKDLLEKGNPLLLLTNDKVQHLMERVMSSDLPVENIHENDVPGGLSKNSRSLADKASATPIYRWRDERGVWQYSDLQNIPEGMRESAQAIHQRGE